MALGCTTKAFSFFIFSAASSRPVFCFFFDGSASACWEFTMNWEYCSALANRVSSCAFLASGLSFASRLMDLSVAAAACNSTGALVGVVSVAWDWSRRAVTLASSSACSSGSSSIEPAAWRLRWFTWFVAAAVERSRSRGLSTPRYRP